MLAALQPEGMLPVQGVALGPGVLGFALGITTASGVLFGIGPAAWTRRRAPADESGPHFRPHDLAWPRSMRRRCEDQGIAFFFKQSAARFPARGTKLDGEFVRAFPAPRQGMSAPLDQLRMEGIGFGQLV